MLLTLSLICCLAMMGYHFFRKVKGNALGVKTNRAIIGSFCRLLLISLLLVDGVVYLITSAGLSYTNIQHTALRLSGITFRDGVSYASANNPHASLSGSEEGNVAVQANGNGAYSIQYSALSLPLMTTDSNGGNTQLVNNILPKPITSGLIIISPAGDTLLDLAVKAGIGNSRGYTFRYARTVRHSSVLKSAIENQLPVTQLLKTGETDNSGAYLDGSFKAAALLEGSRLIYSDAYDKFPEGLYLFPGENLQYEAPGLRLFADGVPIQLNKAAMQGTVALIGSRQFYLLQNANSRYNRLYGSPGPGSSHLLLYTNPGRLALPPAPLHQTVHCQLTSSFDTVLSAENRLFLQPFRLPAGSPFAATATLSYTVEKGQKPFLLNVDGTAGTVRIPGSKSDSYLLPAANKAYSWVITTQDFIRENGFSFPLHILLPSILFVILCWLLLSVFWVDATYAHKGKDRSALIVGLYPFIKKWQPLSASARFNPVWCYVLWTIGVLLPVRYLLQWRMASFPPLQVQSVQGFNSLTHYFNGWSFWGEQLCLLLFFILLAVIARAGRPVWWNSGPLRRKLTVFYIAIGAAAVIALLGLFIVPYFSNHGVIGLGKRAFTLCIPLCVFFIFIQSWLYVRLSLAKTGALPPAKGLAARADRLILRWANMSNSVHWMIWITVLLIFWGVSLYRIEKSFLLILILSLIIWALLSGFKRTQKGVMIGAFASLLGLVFLIVALPFFSSTGPGFSFLDKVDAAKQTLSRLQLLAEDRDSLLMNNPAYTLNDTLFTKLVETSKNQHIINNYQSFKTGWFNDGVLGVNIKPHHNYNNDYATQASDLAGLRYINAEYGWLCLAAIVLLLLAPLIARMLLVYDRNNDNTAVWFFGSGGLIYQRDMFYLLVVAITAIMVALSSSNLFVFMGLDLPVVGFNSKMALIFPLVAFGLFAASFSTETESIAQPMGKRSEGSPAAKQIFAIVSFGLLLTVALVSVNAGFIGSIRYKNKTAAASYSLDHFADAVRQEMEQLSPLLAEVQYALPANGTARLTDRMLMDAVLHRLDSMGRNISSLASFAIRHTHRICSNPALWYNAADEFVQAEKATDTDSATGEVKEYFKFSVNPRPFHLSSPLVETADVPRPDVLAPGADTLHTVLLAKAVNINGSFQYVFPQKSRFPLIYDLVADRQRDTTGNKSNEPVMLSVDLALHDTLQSILNRTPSFTKGNIDRYLPLVLFARLPYSKKISRNNGTGIYWDPHTLTFNGGNSALTANIIGARLQNRLQRLYTSGQSYQINGWLTATLSEYTDSVCTPVFVTTMDADGAIRSLFAYNTGYTYDPNEIQEFDRAEEGIRKYNTNELLIENNLRIHPCLQKLKHGPGSSLKPIVYNAMMSGCNLPWGSLAVENNYGGFITGDYLNQYAGLKLRTDRGGWPVAKPGGVFNEYGGPSPIKPADYLAYSSNLYHSAVLFLGGYTRAQLQKSNLGLSHTAAAAPFPKIILNNQVLYFPAKSWPRFGDTASLLMSSLRRLYGFTIRGLLGEDDYYNGHEQIYGAPPAVEPGPLNTKMDVFKTYIWTATAGGNPFHISPLQMAVLGTKLFTQNVSLHAGYFSLPDSATAYQPFPQDASYTGGFAQYKAKMDSLILQPLSEDIFMPGRTLHALLLSGLGSGMPLTVLSGRSQLNVYAKTGTANVANSRGVNKNSSDKLLLGCLADGKLTGVQKKKPKVLTFFIDHVEGAGKSEDRLRKEILLAIARSQQTQKYFSRP